MAKKVDSMRKQKRGKEEGGGAGCQVRKQGEKVGEEEWVTGKERVIERHTGGETRRKYRQTGGIVEGNVDKEEDSWYQRRRGEQEEELTGGKMGRLKKQMGGKPRRENSR